MTTLEATTEERLLREYHRRLTHIAIRRPRLGSELAVQVQGELIGLLGAIGIVLGGDVQGGEADELARARYLEWANDGASASAACVCPLCMEGGTPA